MGLAGDWYAKTASGKKAIEGFEGELACNEPSKQFPTDWNGKKSITHTWTFVVPQGTTAVNHEAMISGASLTLPLK